MGYADLFYSISHICRFIWPAVRIHISLAIKHIILYVLKLIIVVLIARLILGLELLNIALLKSQHIKHLCAELICCQVLILHWEVIHIAPHKVLCLVKVSVLYIIICEFKSRQMISIHYKHHRLIEKLKALYKLSYKLIHLMQLITIICPLRIKSLIACSGNLYRIAVILLVKFRRISSMSLDTDRKDEVPGRSKGESLHYLSCQDIILLPVFLSVMQIVHILHRCKCVKSHILVHLISVIECTIMVMHRMC